MERKVLLALRAERNGRAAGQASHFRRGKPEKSEKYGLTVWLCHGSCHLSGARAVHNNRETMDALHEYGQRRAMQEQSWTREEFVREFGKNYLE